MRTLCLAAVVATLALAACSSVPQMPKPGGALTCLNCDKWDWRSDGAVAGPIGQDDGR